MHKSTLSYSLPEQYLAVRKVLLVPSLSLYRTAKDYFASSLETRTAPALADACSPLFLSPDTVLIGPFIGADGICYLLELLLAGKENTSVYFTGYGGGIITDDTGNFPFPVSDIENFHIENSNSEIISMKSSSEGGKYSLLSTLSPLSETAEKMSTLHNEYSVNLIDMECAFIKKRCNLISAEFYPTIIVRDIWNIEKGTHHIIKKPSITELQQVFKEFINSASLA
jgi:hypothetical protein